MQPKSKPLKRKQQAPASSEVKKKTVVKSLNDVMPHKVEKSRKQQQQGEDTTPCGVCKVRFVTMYMKPTDENGLPVLHARLGSTTNVKDLRKHLDSLMGLLAFLAKTRCDWLLSR